MSHANRGREWQQEVESTLTAGTIAGRWEWQRNEPWRKRKDESEAATIESAIRKGKGVPDYTLLGPGWWAYVEVKDCQSGRWRWSEVGPAQAERLDRFARIGGAYVLLRLGEQVILMQWAAVAHHWHARRSRFTPACGLTVGAQEWAGIIAAECQARSFDRSFLNVEGATSGVEW